MKHYTPRTFLIFAVVFLLQLNLVMADCLNDTIPPFAKTKNVTIQLDASGNATISPSDINNGSYDNCQISRLSLNRTNFSCSDLTNTTPNFALDFDGTDDRVVSFSSIGLPQGATGRTVEMWIKTSQTNAAALFSFGNFAYLQRSALYMVSGRLYFVGEFNDVWGGTKLVNDNKWHHVAFTLTGQNIRFYIDGQFDFATTLPTVPQTTGTPWAMSNTSGINYTREPYKGIMDEVRVWSVVRTDAEIQASYNKPLGGNEANLVSYYTFDEGSGSVLHDLTHNHNDGALTNMDPNTDWVAGAPPFNRVHRVRLMVTDTFGNKDSANALVTVIDNMAPNVLTKNVYLQLDNNGQASITVNDVNNGSSDNCGIVSMTVAPTTFDCDDISSGNDGVLKSNLTVDNAFEYYISTDNNSTGTLLATGNNFGVKYSNTTNLVQGQDYWIHVKAIDLGLIEMFIGDFKLSGSFQFDNGLQTLGTNTANWKVSRTGFGQNERTPRFVAFQGSHPWFSTGYSFGAYHVWDSVWNTNGNDTVYFSTKITATSTSNLVYLTATDASGNSSSKPARVIVKDNMAPTVLAQNVYVNLDENGQASITANDVDNGSSDNCGIESLSVTPNTFDCEDVSTGTDGVLKSNLTVDNAFEYYISTDNNSNGALLLTGNNWGAKYSNTTNLTQGQDYWIHVKAIDLGLIEMFIGDFTLTGSFKFDNGTQTLGTNTANWKVSKTGFGQNEQTPRFVAYQGSNPWYSSGYSYGAYHIWDSVWNTNGSETVYFSTKITATSNSNLVTLTATDGSGNSSSKTARVIVKDILAPTVITQDVTVQLDGNGQASITTNDVNNGSSDNCGIASMTLDKTSFDCSDVGENTVTLTVTDVNGNASTGTAVVTVKDNLAPSVLTQNVTVQLDENGYASVSASQVNNGSSDNCEIEMIALDLTSFNCSNVGQNTVTLTVTDVNGNASTGTAVVFVEDDTPPTVVTQNVTVQLDGNGNATVSATQVNNGSTDNCEIEMLALDLTSFGCSNIGQNTVTLTVTDVNGNASTGTAVVFVEDNTPPTVLTQNVYVQLDENGQASITTNDVDNGSTDNCGIESLSVSPNTFDCSNVSNGTDGILKSNMTVDNEFEYYISTDNNSNGTLLLTGNNWGAKYSNTTNLAQGQDYWIHIKAIDLGLIEMFIGDFQLTGSFKFDNGLQTLGTNTANWKVSKTGFGQNEQTPRFVAYQGSHPWYSWGYSYGAYHIWDSVWNTSGNDIVYFSTKITATSTTNMVYLTATDASGNSSSNTARVIVADNIFPTVITQDVTVQLDENGYASVSAAQINNGSYDNCEIASMTLDITSFDCSNVGENTVTLTVTDVNGNVSIGTAFVYVHDNTAPTVVTQNVTVQLDGDGNASVTASQVNNGSSDNCEIEYMSLDITSFDCSNVGENTVTLTVTDVNGNASSGTAVVFVEDNSAPTVVTQNVTVQLDENGNASVTASQINNGSTDNCEIEMIALDLTSFNCSNVGENTVTLTVNDVNGNSAAGTAVVTVEDNIAPTVVTQNITVELDEFGEVSITASQIDNESYDNCGIYNLSLDITSFDCSNVGENTVTLTVTDVNGNSSSGQAVVTVEDNISPTISVVLTPNFLWPPNHKMQTITASVTVDDNCAGEGLSLELISVTSNEPDNGLGDGDKPNDIQNVSYGTSDLSFDLRKERSGRGDGRIYTVTYKVTDASGNETIGVAYVTVPHDMGKTAEEFVDGNNSGEGLSDEQSIFVYPNPTSDFINFKYNSNVKGTVSFVLYDLLNNEINKGTFSNTDLVNEKIDLRGLASGIYMLKVQANDETKIIQVVKVK